MDAYLTRRKGIWTAGSSLEAVEEGSCATATVYPVVIFAVSLLRVSRVLLGQLRLQRWLPMIEGCCSVRHKLDGSLRDVSQPTGQSGGALLCPRPTLLLSSRRRDPSSYIGSTVMLVSPWSVLQCAVIEIYIYMWCGKRKRHMEEEYTNAAVACCSYPLVNLPMLGNAPKTIINDTVIPVNGTETSVLYVQQVVLRVGVMPWTEDLTLMDAFRGPLYEVFNLLEIIQNYQHPETLVKGTFHLAGWLNIDHITTWDTRCTEAGVKIASISDF